MLDTLLILVSIMIYTLSKKAHIMTDIESKKASPTKKIVVRYDENPFVSEMVISKTSKRVKVSSLGKDDNVLVNQNTGEVLGTHITTFKQVDADQFVKLFTQNIALTFDLKAAGIKAFNVLVWTIQNKAISSDLVALDKYTVDDFLKAHSELKIKLSPATFLRGLSELEDAKIVAKNIRQGFYYINPNFVFNGDRIAFSTVIEKRKKEKSCDTPLQIEINDAMN